MIKLFSLLGLVFLVLGLVFNIMPKLPRIPGDLYIDKFGFKIYIPFVSAIILSVILTLSFNFFNK
ncbi:MAG: DUF2905 domain-containing protein [Candidatus Daviesbacteria bacterium]|nr:DUF2905 domain-containing protein [Candidatus Daviesbacteria bacterium]